jgi:hypothetical protein
MKMMKMMKTRLVLVVAAALSLHARPAYAHHAFASEFDGSKPVTLTGTITKVEWTNPHTYFYIDVVDEHGKVTNWSIEAPSPGALSRRGWKREDLKLGGKVKVEGYRAKDGSSLADGRLVTLPDGRKIYGGSPGDGGPGDDGTDQGSLPGTSK